MKRFEFSLDRLLRVKRQLEHVAELEQRRAQSAVEEARATLGGLHAQLDRIADQFVSAVGRAMAPGQWAGASGMAERVGVSIRASEEAVAAAEQRLHSAAQERAQLATEVEALATLRRQQLEKWQYEAQKADQDALDELVQRRWQAAKDDAEPAVVAFRTAEPAA